MKIFSRQYFDELVTSANQSDRLRAHTNLHQSYSDPCQKLFNLIKAESYIRPHRHSLDPKEECLLAVAGLFSLISFSDDGIIESVNLFGSEKYSLTSSIAFGLELPAEVWHTVIPLVDQSILFEVKSGPFDPGAAKELAPWAPEEGSQEALTYFRQLKEISQSILAGNSERQLHS